MLFFSRPETTLFLCWPNYGKFQSRNRDAFLFKRGLSHRPQAQTGHGFNLVIEMLFFSSCDWCENWIASVLFQSRNRDAFLFKIVVSVTLYDTDISFQSRNRDAFLFKVQWHTWRWRILNLFQSRNRDAFLFKPTSRLQGFQAVFMLFQSRNRDAFLFKF